MALPARARPRSGEGNLLYLREMIATGFKALHGSSITFERQGCTSLVGANNSGKSSYLRALELFFSQQATLAADERTLEYTGDITIDCVVESDQDLNHGGTVFPRNTPIKLRRSLEGERLYSLFRSDDKIHATYPQITSLRNFLPSFLYLKTETIPYQFNTQQPMSPTLLLLTKQLDLQNPAPTISRRQKEGRAKKALTRAISEIWKSGMALQVDHVSAGPMVTLSLFDSQEHYFAVNDVGTGLQRVLSLAVQLTEARGLTGEHPLLAIIDEPETSLHPSAQRDLLAFLKSLPACQVVYATHSASMIDTAQPETIRTIVHDRATVRSRVLTRKHLHDNYQTIRLALGLLPSDSLSYGFVNVIVEGAIDLLVYSIWAQKLNDAKKLQLDLNMMRFLNGGGSSTPITFDVAISTGLPTIALLDADQAGRNYARKIEDKILSRYSISYPAIHFTGPKDENLDLESTFPSLRLLNAVNAIVNPPTPITEQNLNANAQWKRSKNLEEALRIQQINFDEFKTEVSLEVAREMTVDEIPAPIIECFRQVSLLIKKSVSQLNVQEKE